MCEEYQEFREMVRDVINVLGGREVAKAVGENANDWDLADDIAEMLYNDENQEAIDEIIEGIETGAIDGEGFDTALEGLMEVVASEME